MAVPAILTGRPVLLAGAVIVLVQLAFRAWALFGSWFQFDDFALMSKVMNEPLSLHMLLTPYGGHVMPAGFFLTWVYTHVSPLSFVPPATTLFVLQAAASFGCLALLIHAFGERWGILLPLAVYLFSVITLPAYIWWAAGIDQLPMQVVFFWGLYTHLSYLRTRRRRYAVFTMLLVLGGLAFYEKTLLLFGAFAILALGYFAEGDVLARVRTLWKRYRFGVVLYSVIAGAYLIAYVSWGLNFDPGTSNRQSFVPVALRLAGSAFTTGIVGGPLHWIYPSALFAIADPAEVVVFFAWVVVLAAMFHISRTRRRSMRAWLLPLWFLVADVLLVTAGRARYVGPAVALDYRYQTELAGAAALALGLALFPLRQAREPVEIVQRSWFFDLPYRAGAAAVAIVVLGTTSAVQYATHWRGAHQSRNYFSAIDRGLRAHPRAPLVDSTVPGYLMWGFGYPANTDSHVLRMFSSRTSYPVISADSLYMIDDGGRIRPVTIPVVRRNLPGPDAGCGYRVRQGADTAVPLDGPVFGAGWWLRVGYYSDVSGLITVVVGNRLYPSRVAPGLHSIYLQSSGRYSSVTFSGLDASGKVCVTDVTLGLPQPTEVP